jgi:hypothetical protein
MCNFDTEFSREFRMSLEPCFRGIHTISYSGSPFSALLAQQAACTEFPGQPVGTGSRSASSGRAVSTQGGVNAAHKTCRRFRRLAELHCTNITKFSSVDNHALLHRASLDEAKLETWAHIALRSPTSLPNSSSTLFASSASATTCPTFAALGDVCLLPTHPQVCRPHPTTISVSTSLSPDSAFTRLAPTSVVIGISS